MAEFITVSLKNQSSVSWLFPAWYIFISGMNTWV